MPPIPPRPSGYNPVPFTSTLTFKIIFIVILLEYITEIEVTILVKVEQSIVGFKILHQQRIVVLRRRVVDLLANLLHIGLLEFLLFSVTWCRTHP